MTEYDENMNDNNVNSNSDSEPVSTSYRYVGEQVHQDNVSGQESNPDIEETVQQGTPDIQTSENVQQEAPKYSETYTGNQTQNSYTFNDDKKKKKKKTGGTGKKIVAVVLAAVLFGVIAGGVMVGITYIGNKTINKQETAKVSSVTDNLNNVLTSSSNSNGDIDVNAISKAVLPAMVKLNGTVTSSTSGSSFGIYGGMQSYEAEASGTGIIVGQSDTELLILTNAHVVSEVNNLSAEFVDGQSVSCSVKGSRSDKDVAVVAVKLSDIGSSTLSAISIAELGESDGVEVGNHVVAIGNALGEGQAVTVGYVSALNRSITVSNYTYEGLFMTDAAINAGNSGGALLNAAGQVIGINFAKTASSASSSGVEGMAYAIPISSIRDLVDSLMTEETREEVAADKASYLGIGGQDITSSMASQYGYPTGLIITQVQSGSAADKAGLAKYDILVSFDNQSVSTLTGLKNIMKYYSAGETVNIGYYHLDGNEYVLKNVDVTLGSSNS